MNRVLTGDRPTGKLHLGHYAGSLTNRIALQNEHDCFIMVADIQALTDNFANPAKVRSHVFDVVADNLSVGIDPSKVTYFIQSEIPEIAELTVLFSNLVSVSELQRNPTVKNEIQEKGTIFKDGVVNLGFLAYPVSQAADICFCKADLVPVGKDQKPMIEQTGRIIEKFSYYYGDVFKKPKGLFSKISKLNGLDGRKMSKSLGNAIYLTDSQAEIQQKISTAATDSLNYISYDEIERPNISNLISYFSLVTNQKPEEIVKKYEGITSYKIFKDDLASAINDFLTPIRARRNHYDENPRLVWDLLASGKNRAREEGSRTMLEVRKVMKINY